MDAFQIIALVNLCAAGAFYGTVILGRIGKRKRLFGAKKIDHKFMFVLTVFSSLLLLFLWISYIAGFTAASLFLVLLPVAHCALLKWIAVIVISAATLLEIAAGVTLGAAFRIHVPESDADVRLVHRGVYGVVRNPIVLGVFIYAFGVALLVPGLPGIVMLLGVIVSYDFKVNTEARELENRFGAEWRNYCRTTGKYLPLPARRAGEKSGKNK
jgi:protein-S-isoprenylcysteine O-methyltransferase Ste14